MRFVDGCDFEEFRRYLMRIGQYTAKGELEKLKSYIDRGHFNLAVFRENYEIIGHAVWHESNTEEHRKGDCREKEDREMLLGFFGGKKDFVELHELWLTQEYIGKGYGKRFFEWFEEYIQNEGYDSIVYYAFDPAAVALCRKRGYKEAGPFGKIETMYVFCLRLQRKQGASSSNKP